MNTAPRSGVSFTGAVWQPQRVDELRVDALVRGGLHPAAARCLVQRDLGSPDTLDPDRGHLHDPMAMLGMDRAVERLRKATRDGHKIRILTDYDVDGTTSSLILQAALRRIAPDLSIDYHIPDRFLDGYGFSEEASAKAAADGVDLIVTADIGVRDHAAVARAREHGIDVLICDHHLPDGAAVPDGATVLCPPQAGCTYPNRHLAACGVSTKLAQALLVDDPHRERFLGSLLKLAAIGTVADMVSLRTPENRAIVGLGLRELNGGRHGPGLTALLAISDLTPGTIREADLGFRIGPRINAAGRIASATHVVDLLTTPDPERARRLAGELEDLNRTRRTVQAQLVESALRQAEADSSPFLVVAGPEEQGWHRGVIGIVAARLKDELHRPVAVVSIQGSVCVGSVRSTPGLHAVDALSTAAHLMHRFGGHPAAAGFSLPTSRLDELRALLQTWTLAQGARARPALQVDATVPPDDLDEALLGQLQRLGPFGMGNPEPRLVIPCPRPSGLRTIGKDARHLKWSIPRRGRAPIDVLWWGGAEHADALTAGPVELLATLGQSHFRGVTTLQLVVTDARAA
jgi:single-stranded-DNA-specific exonuclease